MTCEIFDEVARTAPLDQFDRASATEWVTSNYSVEAGAMSQTQYNDEQLNYRLGWQAGAAYSLAFLNEEVLNLTVIWRDRQPTLELALTCLGAPERYNLSLSNSAEGSLVELNLWYPTQGLVVQYHDAMLVGDEPPVTAALTLNDMIVTRPGDLESVVRAAYVPRSEPAMQEVLDTVQPWPESFAELPPTLDSRR